MRRIIGRAAAIVLLALLAGGASAEDFYRDKTVKLIISDTGGYDAEARLLVRHLGKHVPGNPTFVVMNMPGASGLTGANYVYNIADRDGTTFALFNRNIILTAVTGNPQVRFKLENFNWLGASGDFSNDPYLFVVRYALPYQDIAALRTANPPVIAGSAGSTDVLRLLQEAIGLSLKVVVGYQKNELDFALERGEVDAQTIASSNLKGRHPDWFTKKVARPVIQLGRVDRFPAFAEVPTARELARTASDLSLVELSEAPLLMAYPFALPPGVPAERLALMRMAFDATLADPAYREDAEKQQLEVTAKTGLRVQQIVASLVNTPKPVVERYKEITGTAW